MSILGSLLGTISYDDLRLERVEASLEVLDVALARTTLERALAVGASDLVATTVDAWLEDKHLTLGFHVRLEGWHSTRDGERMTGLAGEGTDNVAACLAAAALVTSSRDPESLALGLQ